jgi:dihydrofolate reductase
MSKMILFNMMSVDGYFEGPNKELNWHNVDNEFNDFAIEQLSSASLLIFGRLTYEMMAAYWTTPTALENDPIVAEKMNSISKIVFSKTLDNADWNNTRLLKGNLELECKQLKQQKGKNLFIFGSANLASTLSHLGLIDEYRIMINPVLLGKGNPLFRKTKEQLNLKLIRTRTFSSGNVLLFYELERS